MIEITAYKTKTSITDKLREVYTREKQARESLSGHYQALLNLDEDISKLEGVCMDLETGEHKKELLEAVRVYDSLQNIRQVVEQAYQQALNFYQEASFQVNCAYNALGHTSPALKPKIQYVKEIEQSIRGIEPSHSDYQDTLEQLEFARNLLMYDN